LGQRPTPRGSGYRIRLRSAYSDAGPHRTHGGPTSNQR
jgi:hypothetical protein